MVATPPYADGQEITEGKVYRRIPAWATHFNYETQRPTIFAFMPRPQDRGAVSVLLADRATQEEARRNPQKRDDDSNGLCKLDIARVREATGGAVSFRYAPTKGQLGHAHVRIYGCGDGLVAIIVADLAEGVIPPRSPAM